MTGKILFVAEKPAIAKAISQHLSGGSFQTRAVRGNQYVKNYEFSFQFTNSWGNCNVVVTSVLGHLTGVDFPEQYRSWHSCNPATLFEAPVVVKVDKDKEAIATNITTQARYAKALFIWTDCDREGEHIGTEVRDAAVKGKPNIEVKRAKFSNTERAHVMQAARNPIELDEKQANAVAARIELDLRLGALMTRWQTLTFRTFGVKELEEKVISYGSCQFPTLGFVVDRYFQVRNFVPEQFWTIELFHQRDGIKVKLNWDRNRLFDRMSTVILFERALSASQARVTDMQRKPTSKWKPLPLTTVELQRLGSLFLRMDSQRVMRVAEDLYNKGWISYPRTETDSFDGGMDLRALVQKQTQDHQWGTYAQSLLNGNFRQPRAGRHNDQAHPPIHPVNFVVRSGLNADEARVYEFVTRRFLGACSEDAKGETTTVKMALGDEGFHATGLIVLERNYLDVYTYDKWESSQQLPKFTIGESFEPKEAYIRDGKTTAPSYLTEPELIQLMDKNGIGTDATMAEHIAKIREREYVIARPKGGGRAVSDTSIAPGTGGRGGRGGRGRGGGRGGASGGGSSASGGVLEFIPTTLGTALIKGYDDINLETSLSKPFLRKQMELSMREICAGHKGKREFVQETIEQYRIVFGKVEREARVLRAAITRYMVNGGV